MKEGLTLEAMLATIVEQNKEKRDLVTSTKDNVRLIQDAECDGGVALVLLRDGALELEKLELLDHAHNQIATRLNIPLKHYRRLLADHPDLVIHQVNALFEREPASRMIRVLGNKVRAFLSNSYARLDNYDLMTGLLPSIMGGPEHRVMSSNINEHDATMKVIYTGDELSHEVARAHGQPRVIRPGFRFSNSETGRGALRIEAFFYDSYCTNGCVFGVDNALELSRTHLGGKVLEGVDFEVVSQDTDRRRHELVMSEARDIIKTMSNPERVAQMAEVLRAKANGEKAERPTAAVDALIRELPITETEKGGVLETFLRDGDFSQFGLASAVTEQANKNETSYDRANELEDFGAKILAWTPRQWHQVAVAA